MSSVQIGMLIAGVGIVAWIAITYTRLMAMRKNVQDSWSVIEGELSKRSELLPLLTASVETSAGFEHPSILAVRQAQRTASSLPGTPEQQAAAQMTLEHAVAELVATSNNYPDLQEEENFKNLVNQLEEVQARLAHARRFYNSNVHTLNLSLETFPTVLLCGPLGFAAQAYFGLD